MLPRRLQLVRRMLVRRRLLQRRPHQLKLKLRPKLLQRNLLRRLPNKTAGFPAEELRCLNLIAEKVFLNWLLTVVVYVPVVKKRALRFSMSRKLMVKKLKFANIARQPLKMVSLSDN